MSNQSGGENHSRKKDFLESGKPTHYINTEEEFPLLDAVTELDKVEGSLRRTHAETLENRQYKSKTWVDSISKTKKYEADKGLNL